MAKKRCMVCAKRVTILKGEICELCQERIRREAMGEQASVSDRADKELRKHGVAPNKK
jgi:rRNA maturation endonuclease Nob1